MTRNSPPEILPWFNQRRPDVELPRLPLSDRPINETRALPDPSVWTDATAVQLDQSS